MTDEHPSVPAALKTRHHVQRLAFPHIRDIRNAVASVEGVNAKIAVAITRGVGTMACAYAFALLACISLPSVIRSGNIVAIVSWVAQTLFQLVLLSIILVGQNVQNAAADARATRTFDDVEAVKADLTRALDRLDTDTQGGLQAVIAHIDKHLKP